MKFFFNSENIEKNSSRPLRGSGRLSIRQDPEHERSLRQVVVGQFEEENCRLYFKVCRASLSNLNLKQQLFDDLLNGMLGNRVQH